MNSKQKELQKEIWTLMKQFNNLQYKKRLHTDDLNIIKEIKITDNKIMQLVNELDDQYLIKDKEGKIYGLNISEDQK